MDTQSLFPMPMAVQLSNRNWNRNCVIVCNLAVSNLKCNTSPYSLFACFTRSTRLNLLPVTDFSLSSCSSSISASARNCAVNWSITSRRNFHLKQPRDGVNPTLRNPSLRYFHRQRFANRNLRFHLYFRAHLRKQNHFLY